MTVEVRGSILQMTSVTEDAYGQENETLPPREVKEKNRCFHYWNGNRRVVKVCLTQMSPLLFCPQVKNGFDSRSFSGVKGSLNCTFVITERKWSADQWK